MPADAATRPRRALSRLLAWSWPARYPVAQFPNAPLAIALAASAASKLVHGQARDATQAVATVGLAAWAYEELRYGVNGFRRTLGATFLAITVVRLTRALA